MHSIFENIFWIGIPEYNKHKLYITKKYLLLEIFYAYNAILDNQTAISTNYFVLIHYIFKK